MLPAFGFADDEDVPEVDGFGGRRGRRGRLGAGGNDGGDEQETEEQCGTERAQGVAFHDGIGEAVSATALSHRRGWGSMSLSG